MYPLTKLVVFTYKKFDCALAMAPLTYRAVRSGWSFQNGKRSDGFSSAKPIPIQHVMELNKLGCFRE